MIFAETAFYLTSDAHTATVIFYVGLIIENILFSLALGAKQKIILQEKNISQEKFINQLKENEKLKNKIQKQLEQNVKILSKQAEIDKIENLKTKFDKELTELKMISLRSQMNPHFIFNSLNSIKLYIINNEKENAVYYLNKFSKLIRKILATTQEIEISLADEIETMNLYLSIENIRFNNEIDYKVIVDDHININTIKVPCLILQPFLENAIWHGLSLKKSNRKLNINIVAHDSNHVNIRIVDNGIGRKRSREINEQKMLKRDSVGIKITKERFKNFFMGFKNDYSITFTDLYDEDANSQGTEVVLRIPLK
jgi:LytS/YehU family sensor histidine kinase